LPSFLFDALITFSRGDSLILIDDQKLMLLIDVVVGEKVEFGSYYDV